MRRLSILIGNAYATAKSRLLSNAFGLYSHLKSIYIRIYYFNHFLIFFYMPKIQDIINDLNISREDLAVAYKQAIGKALPARAVNMKEEERTLVEKELKNPSAAKTPTKKSTAKTTKATVEKTAKAAKEDKEDDSKVLKSDELFG